MPKWPYCNQAFKSGDLRVETLDGVTYNTEYGVVFCPNHKCEKVLGFVKIDEK